MPQPDRETLIRSLTSHRPPICDRIESRRSVPTEASAIIRQDRREKIRILEEAAQNKGINLRELRASLARNRKQRDEALAALRSRTVASQSKPPAVAAPANRLFTSLKPLAGRLVPLAQPSFAFLNAPYSFDKYEYGGTWLWNTSLTPGDAFFQTNVYTTEPTSYAVYTFRYVWNNDSDTPMLATVFAGLSFTGWLSVAAQDGYPHECWEAQVRESLTATLDLGSPDNPSIESHSSRLCYLIADNGFWGMGSGLAEQLYNAQDFSVSLEGFLVPPNSSLVISVSTAFSFEWFWDTPISLNNYAQADFGEDLFPANRVVSNGVTIFTSPVVIQ